MHLSIDQKNQLGKILDSCGTVEVLRFIGQFACNDFPDMEIGTRIRSEICKTAKFVDAQWKKIKEP